MNLINFQMITLVKIGAIATPIKLIRTILRKLILIREYAIANTIILKQLIGRFRERLVFEAM